MLPTKTRTMGLQRSLGYREAQTSGTTSDNTLSGIRVSRAYAQAGLGNGGYRSRQLQ